MKIKIMVLLTTVVVSIMLFVAGCLPPPGYYRGHDHGHRGYDHGRGHGGHRR